MGHVHVALAALLGADDVAQAGRGEDQGAVTIGKRSAGAPGPLGRSRTARVVKHSWLSSVGQQELAVQHSCFG
jgi:hypothetical protein